MTRTLFAYLDAGSASAIVTIILGGIAGLGVVIRYRWNKLLVLLRIRKPLEEEATAGDRPAPAAAPTEAPAPAAAPPEAREPAKR